MKFVNCSDAAVGIEILADRIASELVAGHTVLWLLPGGSNIPASVAVMGKLRHDCPEKIKNLTLLLSDERYGPLKHVDSNYFQLKQAGFTEGDATFIQTLVNATLDDTVKYYGEAYQELLAKQPVVIGQFGMGADGHIAGVLPGSPAVTSQESAVCYDAGQFERITLTLKSLKKVKAAYVFVFGEPKCQALQTLRGQSLPVQDQPAQLFKTLPEATIFNDQLGDES